MSVFFAENTSRIFARDTEATLCRENVDAQFAEITRYIGRVEDEGYLIVRREDAPAGFQKITVKGAFRYGFMIRNLSTDRITLGYSEYGNDGEILDSYELPARTLFAHLHDIAE